MKNVGGMCDGLPINISLVSKEFYHESGHFVLTRTGSLYKLGNHDDDDFNVDEDKKHDMWYHGACVAGFVVKKVTSSGPTHHTRLPSTHGRAQRSPSGSPSAVPLRRRRKVAKRPVGDTLEGATSDDNGCVAAEALRHLCKQLDWGDSAMRRYK